MARVFIGIPQHGGNMNAVTFASALTAASQKGHDVQFQALGLSLLARNFNALFINAWRHKFDVFVLHHSDIGVRKSKDSIFVGSWLDKLIERLFETEAAAVSIVSPIKSPAGHTSFGLDMEDSEENPYSLRRVTVRQLQGLPDTISRVDLCRLFGVDEAVAGAMLINTGVLAMNLRDFDWRGWPGFQIQDNLGWKKDGSNCEAFTEPEDWRLSRWMHNKGWPYYGIQDLRIAHIGSHTFENHGDWGDEEDKHPIQKSLKEYES